MWAWVVIQCIDVGLFTSFSSLWFLPVNLSSYPKHIYMNVGGPFPCMHYCYVSSFCKCGSPTALHFTKHMVVSQNRGSQIIHYNYNMELPLISVPKNCTESRMPGNKSVASAWLDVISGVDWWSCNWMELIELIWVFLKMGDRKNWMLYHYEWWIQRNYQWLLLDDNWGYP